MANEWRIPIIEVVIIREAGQVIFAGASDLLATIFDMGQSTDDLEPPAGDESELKVLRFCSRSLPVMLLGVSKAEARLLRGLDVGAIYYMVKPLRRIELLARMRAHVHTFERARNVSNSVEYSV